LQHEKKETLLLYFFWGEIIQKLQTLSFSCPYILTSLLIGSNGDIDDDIDGNIHSRKASHIALNIARSIVSGS